MPIPLAFATSPIFSGWPEDGRAFILSLFSFISPAEKSPDEAILNPVVGYRVKQDGGMISFPAQSRLPEWSFQ
jgi:hypothetical protein